MGVEIKDILGWGITGSIGLLGLFLNWQTRRDARRKEDKQAAAMWSLHLSQHKSDTKGKLFRLKLDNPDTNKYRLAYIRSKNHGKWLIANASYQYGDDGRGRGFHPYEYSQILIVDENLEPDNFFDVHGIRDAPYASVHFFAAPPKLSAWRRKKRERLVIEIAIEEISSARTESRRIVRSEPIEWTTSSPTSTI